jgi:hypothetical protein
VAFVAMVDVGRTVVGNIAALDTKGKYLLVLRFFPNTEHQRRCLYWDSDAPVDMRDDPLVRRKKGLKESIRYV